MTAVVAIITGLGSIAGLGLYLFKRFKTTPQEKRRKNLAKLDTAMKQVKDEMNPKELSKWLSDRL
jgi:shikimate kinase